MKQYSHPLVIDQSKVESLIRVNLQSKDYNEDWIQEICFSNPKLLPIDEVEATFSGGIPICRELSVASGAVDLIYVNESGFITIGECKLWRNPEARRKVIGQILDYAKDISAWSYTDFEQKCLEARKGEEESLYQIIQNVYPDADEVQFIDSVQKNLTLGRFLLLVIGDGIHQNTEQIMKYLDSYGQLSFSLGLIELPVYKKPGSDLLVITPRILARTIEVEKHVYKILERTKGEEIPTEPSKETRTTISEKVFYERLEENTSVETVKGFREFIDRLSIKVNIKLVLGRGKTLSLNIKTADKVYNYASIQETGEVWFYGVVTKSDELGDRSVGIEYLKQLAKIVGGKLYDDYAEWNWCVKDLNNEYIQISRYLKHSEDWIELIKHIQGMVSNLLEE